jgi:hypothetical protein
VGGRGEDRHEQAEAKGGVAEGGELNPTDIRLLLTVAAILVSAAMWFVKPVGPGYAWFFRLGRNDPFYLLFRSRIAIRVAAVACAVMSLWSIWVWKPSGLV